MEQNTIFHKSLRRHERRQMITILSAVIAIAAFFAVQASLSRNSEALSSEPRCGMEEHVHTDACYDDEGNLICTLPEHTHTEECYQEEVQIEESGEAATEEAGTEELQTINLNIGEGEEIYLSRVLDDNETGYSSADVVDIFGEISPVTVKQTNGDWIVYSGDSFSGTQNLMVCFSDANKIILAIQAIESIETNAGKKALNVSGTTAKKSLKAPLLKTMAMQTGNATDFGPYITSAVVAKLINNQYVASTEFEEDDLVRVTIDYHMQSGIVTTQNNTIEYSLPEGINIIGSQTGKAYRDGDAVGDYSIDQETRKITIVFYDSYADGKEFDGNVFFDGIVKATDSGDERYISFNEKGEIHVNSSSSLYDFSIAKTSTTVDTETNTASFTIEVSSEKGTKPDSTITINDRIVTDSNEWYKVTGTAVIDNSLQVKKVSADSTESIVSGYLSDIQTTTFSLSNLPALGAGEKYIVTYSVSNLKATGEDGFGSIRNYAGATDGSTSKEVYKDLEISKASVEKSGYYDNNKGAVYWTVTVNQSKNDISGKTITDIIPEGTTVVYPETNTISIIKDNWENVGQATVTGNTISYTFGENSNGTYSFSYWTTVPSSASSVTNTVTFEEKTASATVSIPERTISPTKTWLRHGGEMSPMTYYWKTEVTIPEEGIDQSGLSFTDTILSPVMELETAGGDHYTLYGDLKSAIEKNLVLLGINGESSYSSSGNLNLEVTYYDKNGTALTGNIATDQKVYSFTVKLTSSTSHAVTDYVKVLLKEYPTYIDMTGEDVTNTWTITNKVTAGDKESIASHELEKSIPLRKLVEFNYAKHEGNASVAYDTINNNGNHILKYYVLIDRNAIQLNDGDYALSITDVIPEGTVLKQDTVTFGFCDEAMNSTSASVWDNGKEYVITDNTTLEVNERTFTARFKNRTADNVTLLAQLDSLKYIYISYELSLDELLGGGEYAVKLLDNKVSWDNTEVHQKTTVNVDNENLWKLATIKNDGSNPASQPRISYKVYINRAAEDMDPNSDTLTITDTIQTNAGVSMNVNSLKVYNYSNTAEGHLGTPLHGDYYQLSYSEENSKYFELTIPDNKALVLVYDYMFDTSATAGEDGTDNVSVNNSVTLNYQYGHSTNSKIKTIQSGASVINQNVIIQKVDSNDTSNRLTGATFKLEYYDKTENTWKTVADHDSFYLEKRNSSNEIEYDNAGNIIWNYIWGTSSNAEAQGHTLEKDVAYRITELTAPNGYDLNKSPYYFILKSCASETSETAKQNAGVSDQSLSPLTVFGTTGGNLIITNHKKTSGGIGVKKIWKDTNGNIVNGPANKQIRVTLYRIANETFSPVRETVGSVILPYEGKWSYYWDNLPDYDDNNHQYTYWVVETESGGEEITDYTVTYGHGSGFPVGTEETIINQKIETYELPESGGPGIRWLKVTGAALVLMGGVLLVLKKRRDEVMRE